MNNPRLCISFSGGRSSAVMLHRCLERFGDSHDISIIFANTGCEHEETLRFIDAVDREFANGRVVWIEGLTHEQGTGMSAKIVDYKTASRNGEPFEEAIRKYGVFCASHPNCTGRLKTEPIAWYYREVLNWQRGTYDTAIGIRADEIDRMSSKRAENRFVYPLIDEGWRKQDVNKFMAKYDWDLKLPSDAYGNCVWCWKKSLRKLLTVAKHNPEVFDFPAEMESKYGSINKGDQVQEHDRVFFRNRMSAVELVQLSKPGGFKEYKDSEFKQMELFDMLDIGGGCGDSCEVGSDE